MAQNHWFDVVGGGVMMVIGGVVGGGGVVADGVILDVMRMTLLLVLVFL